MNNELQTMNKVRRGFTLIELMVTSVMAVIIILAVGIALAGNIRGWQTTYDRVYSDVVTDSYAARRAFDATIRKACRYRVSIGDSGKELTVYFFADDSSTYPDRYAWFHVAVADGRLLREEGSVDAAGNKTGVVLSTMTVASNVKPGGCVFKWHGDRAIQMILTLVNNEQGQKSTIVTSAVLHNPG